MTSERPWFSPDRHADRRPFLIKRNAIVEAIRGWFKSRAFIEVHCATLQISPGNETHLHAFRTDLIEADGTSHPRYLHTSPEFGCKKLLAAGERRIFTFADAYRNRERTSLHSPAFTMLEWYRAEEDYIRIAEDTLELLRLAADTAGNAELSWKGARVAAHAQAEWITVAEAFRKYAGIDLLSTLDENGNPDRNKLAGQIDFAVPDDDSWSDIFSKVISASVEPNLGREAPTVLHKYPMPEAALARRNTRDPRVADRFEVYVCGVELANGFGELTDAQEQRKRFSEAMALKQALYGERYPLDEDFLTAVSMMPEASGVALGLDRLVMLACGARKIEDVQWTPLA